MNRIFVTLSLALVALSAPGCENNQQADQPEQAESESPEAQQEGQQAAEQEGQQQEGQQEASQTDIPEDQTMTGTSENDHFFVRITPDPNPIPFQELFELEVKVFSGEGDDRPAEDVSLDQVRVTMPAHGHGMKNEPTVSEVSPGVFRVEGMRFHMQGEGDDGLWVIEPVISKNGTIDRAKFEVQCCRQ